MSSIDPIVLLIHLYDVQYNRYNSYKEKISINIGLASAFIVILSFILPSAIESIYKFYIYIEVNECLKILHIIFCITFSWVIIEFFSLYIYILYKSSKSLDPIKITTIDMESIRLWNEGEENKACQIAVNDLNISIESNKKLIDNVYENYFELQSYFYLFIFNGIDFLLYIIYILIYIKIKA